MAEAIAVRFGLTIEAGATTQPGRRPNGAVYVVETDHPDIRVRRSGEPGADVCLLSTKAQKAFPFWIECKNSESFSLASFANGAIDFVEKAFLQCHERPAVVIWRRNYHPTWAFIELSCQLARQALSLPGDGGVPRFALIASPPFLAIKFQNLLAAVAEQPAIPLSFA